MKIALMGDGILEVNITKTQKSRINDPDFENLGFGEVFSDHMLVWNTGMVSG